jgi:hypothetical protein
MIVGDGEARTVHVGARIAHHPSATVGDDVQPGLNLEANERTTK